MKLKIMELSFFKGCKHAIYKFGEKNTTIKGMNRLGKTTIASAYFWCLVDCDYSLTNNPNIFPDYAEECTPMVKLILDVDGKEVAATKIQKKTIKEKGTQRTVSLSNTYEINGVPKTFRDFKEYLEDLGLVFDNFLVCSHPEVFTSQKTADMRKILFKMACEKSDYDIAAMGKETADVAGLLAKYSYEEIEAMQKASKKKAAEQVDAIPNQIIGLEKAKVDIDVAELELARNGLERKITDYDAKIADSGKAVDALCSESMNLQFEINGMFQQANDELIHKRRELENARYEANRAFGDAHRAVSNAESKIAENSRLIGLEERKKPDINARFKENQAKPFDETPYLFDESKWGFDENSTICSLCGQTLPEEKTAAIKADFENRKLKAKADAEKKLVDAREKYLADKENTKKTILAEADAIKAKISELSNENSDLEKELEENRKLEIEAVRRKNQIEKQLTELPTEPDMSGNAEYEQKKARYDELEKQIVNLKESTSAADAFRDEREKLVTELDAVKEKIAQAANNVRIDEQISELQEKQRDYEQAKADAEKILYQLSLVSKKKNELLVEEINNHFGIVKWLLFDYQKNGEYKETCRAYIMADDGTKKFLGDSMNTGREIEAKLDICNSFQKFFDMYVPVFLDGAESLNDCYLPKLDTQLVTLSVSEDRELKVEVV